jgi:GT2 family glycosyltransferase
MSPVLSLVVPLPPSPPAALACLEALATMPEDPAHEVLLVVDAGGALDDLLARVAGDVDVVRVDRRTGLAGAVTAGLERASAPLVAVIRDGALVTPGWLAAVHRHLNEDAGTALVCSVTADTPLQAPVMTLAPAFRREAIASALTAGHLDVPDDLVVAAICTALAEHGKVVVAHDAVVRVAETRSAEARGAWKYGADPELTIVVPTLDATSERLRSCITALQACTDAAHDIVIVDNGSPPQGFTAPVNAGLRAGRGMYLVVCNDDVEVLPGWWPPLRARLDEHGGAGSEVVFPLTVDGAMRQDFAAWCFAMRRGTLDRFGVAPGEFFDPALKVWFQDTDLLVRLRAAGVPPVLVPESRIRHGLSETVGTADPSLRAWIDAQIRRDKEAFEARHGKGVRGAAH